MSKRLPDEHYARIVDLSRNGVMTLDEIAAAYGTTHTAVARWVREARARGLAPDARRGQSLWSNPCPHCGAPASVRKDITRTLAPGRDNVRKETA